MPLYPCTHKLRGGDKSKRLRLFFSVVVYVQVLVINCLFMTDEAKFCFAAYRTEGFGAQNLHTKKPQFPPSLTPFMEKFFALLFEEHVQRVSSQTIAT